MQFRWEYQKQNFESCSYKLLLSGLGILFEAYVKKKKKTKKVMVNYVTTKFPVFLFSVRLVIGAVKQVTQRMLTWKRHLTLTKFSMF